MDYYQTETGLWIASEPRDITKDDVLQMFRRNRVALPDQEKEADDIIKTVRMAAEMTNSSETYVLQVYEEHVRWDIVRSDNPLIER